LLKTVTEKEDLMMYICHR